MILRYITEIITNQTKIIRNWFYHLFVSNTNLAKNDEILKPMKTKARRQKKKKADTQILGN